MKAGFKDTSAPQLVHVATDGESYGHHHRHGEMALAYALRILEEDKSVKLINYGSYLAQFAPEYECEIVENTSWSCSHGVERWRSNCGCNGGKPGFNQLWRAPLRKALNELRDAITPLTEQEGASLFKDVWAARDGYIGVILDRSEDSIASFLLKHEATRSLRKNAWGPRADGDAAPYPAHVHQLRLVFRRHLQHWTVQVIAYAARVLQLAQRLFVEEAGPSSRPFSPVSPRPAPTSPAAGDGAQIYNDALPP